MPRRVFPHARNPITTRSTARHRGRRTARRTPSLKAIGFVAAGLVLALVGGGIAAGPALAATASLTVDKKVDGKDATTIAPGAEFTYTIMVGCDDNDCADATLTDPLPAQFAGFPIVNSAVTPAAKPATATFAGCTAEVTPDCTLTVKFQDALPGGGTGIRAGDTYRVMLTLKAPQDLTPAWASNGVAVTNTARGTSATTDPVSDGAAVTVDIATKVDVSVAKTWTPATQQFQPGAISTVSLSTGNTSNVPATTLVLQDPVSATDGASALDATNPFAVVDFSGFGGTTLPQGAATVQVSAYVLDGASGKWAWTTGPPAATATLPAGVSASDVGGLRLAFASADGAQIAAGGSAGSVGLLVAQRATNRITGTGLVTGATTTNTVASTVTVPGQSPVTKTASAPYAIGGLTVAVTAAKTITPARIPGGATATARISGKNTSNGTVDTLTLSDLDYFTDTLGFGGFSAPISYPAGATAATITWHSSDGQTIPVAVGNQSTPTAPALAPGAHLTGFEITYTGTIAAAAQADATFLIAPSLDFAPASGPKDAPNTVSVSATNGAGTATKTATAPLKVFEPDIALAISKSITPSAPVSPGSTVVAQLPTTTSTDSAYVRPDTIVVEDVWRKTVANDFYNAFDPIAIAATQVPLGSTMTVEYTLDEGATWQTLSVVDASTQATVYRANLPAALQGSITGLRFTFANPNGFAQGTTVRPAITAQARATLRSGDGPTSVADKPASSYTNVGTATASGVVGGQRIDADPVQANAVGRIQSTSGTGTLGIAKKWTKPDLTGDVTDLDSQSGQKAGTVLSWGVTSTGYSQVVITDPATVSGAVSPVFQAFDLLQVSPMSYTAQPLLRWDAVSEVQLYRSGAWQTVPAPAGGWMTASGFAGYTLTPQETADTIGVRLVVVPNDAVRAATTDPTAPPVGSGIATVAFGQSRAFGLVWQLRNVQRDVVDPAHPWVTAGSVQNTVSATGVQNGSPVGPVTGEDTVVLTDQPPLVSLDKTSSRSTIVVPHLGDVDPAAYPTNTFTLTAKNLSTARASYLRVTDPSPCSAGQEDSCLSAANAWAADPFAGASYTAENTFERFDLTRISATAPADQVDADATKVTLWHRAADGTTSTSVVSLRTATGYSAAELADVVGVSVVFQGTSPQTTGGTIASGQALTVTLDTRVRATLRSGTAAVTAAAVDNHAFAQGYDPVLFPSGQGSQPSDADDATVALTTAVLDVTAAKAISPSSLIERDRHTPVSVTLTATQGASTAATQEVTITDDDADFWNSFALTGLTASDVTLPAGADRVRLDVQTDGGSTWIVGVPSATATLPTSAVSSITGIRFVFSRADGGLFSRTATPGDYTARAVLHVGLLDTARDGSAIAFPSRVDDTVQTRTHRTDDPVVYADKTGSADAGIQLDPGTFGLDVAKTPQDNVHTVSVGDTVPWTITFANTGTGYLDVSRLTDTLPSTLSWDGETPVYSTTAGGTLAVTPALAVDGASGELTLTWPAGGARMSPGERFTMVLGLVLEPGLKDTDRATNRFTVTTVQSLAACTNQSGNGQGVLSGLPATECGSSNYVQPVTGPSLFTTKGVKGDVTGSTDRGAVNLTSPGAACKVDAYGYYKSPCAANTVVGGTDQWRLGAVNSGTVPYTSLTLVEPLPTVGDRMLATGAARGSTYRPAFAGLDSLATSAPAGTTVTVEVTTVDAAEVCVGTGATAWPTDPTCSTHPVAAEWTDASAYTGDWAAVTGLRVRLDFTSTAAGELPAGGAIAVTYRTTNRPATAADPTGAPVSISAGTSVAWNQFGATAALSAGGTIRRAPVKAGVTLATGPLRIDKVLTGSAAAKAPDEYIADVQCTVAGAPVDLGAAARSVLSRANGLTARIDGIPVGSRCVVSEDGDEGSYGEAARAVTNGMIDIVSAAVGGEVPAAQVATITNTFEFGRLELKKTASTAIAGMNAPVGYTITVTNIGALDANGITAADQLPAGATFVSADQGGVLKNGVVTWPIAKLRKGASIDLHVVVTYAAESYPVNHATVTVPPVGPWQPPQVDNACSDDASVACAQIYVDPPVSAKPGTLASTGSTGDFLLVALWAGILALVGAALVGWRRRRA